MGSFVLVPNMRLLPSQVDGSYEKICPMSVLDFYVHENCQRQGVGRILFEVGALFYMSGDFVDATIAVASVVDVGFLI